MYLYSLNYIFMCFMLSYKNIVNNKYICVCVIYLYLVCDLINTIWAKDYAASINYVWRLRGYTVQVLIKFLFSTWIKVNSLSFHCNSNLLTKKIIFFFLESITNIYTWNTYRKNITWHYRMGERIALNLTTSHQGKGESQIPKNDSRIYIGNLY